MSIKCYIKPRLQEGSCNSCHNRNKKDVVVVKFNTESVQTLSVRLCRDCAKDMAETVTQLLKGLHARPDGPLDVPTVGEGEKPLLIGEELASRYPKWKDYTGGGSILNSYTSLDDIVFECKVHNVNAHEVAQLIQAGYEVIIRSGEIRGVQKESARR